MQAKAYTFYTNKQSLLIAATFGSGALYMLYLLFFSAGTPLQDEIGHFLLSRDAWHTPELILDLWGRTGHTLVYMLPAKIGLTAARLFSLLIALTTAWLTLKVAQSLELKNYYLVPFFLIFQPWFADLSYLDITEVPFSFLMVLSAYLFLKNRINYASVAAGLLPLFRHEGIVLTALWTLYVLYLKKDLRVIVIPWSPIIVYNLVSYLVTSSWAFSIYLDPTSTGVYGSGSWWHFLKGLVDNRAVGIPVAVLFLGSIVPICSSSRSRVIFGWYGAYFLLHTVIYLFGLFESGGYILFLLPLAPAIAIAAVKGLNSYVEYTEKLLKRLNNTLTSFTPKILNGAACIVTVIMTLLFVRPHPLDAEGLAAKEAAEWVRAEGLSDNKIISTHVYFYYFLPLRVPPKTLWTEFPPINELPVGTLLIWDSHYSDRCGLNFTSIFMNPSWQRMADFENGTTVVFRKRSFCDE